MIKKILATRTIREPKANIVFNGEIFQAFALRSQDELRMLTITNCIQHYVGRPS